MARPPAPIRPRRADERRYLAALRALLDPKLLGLRRRLADANSYIEALQVLASTPLRPNEAIPDTVRQQLESIDIYHRRRTIETLGRALGIDIRPFLSLAGVRPFVDERIRENVSLIRTIEPRFHDALVRDIQRLQAEAPFDRQALRRVLAHDYRSTGYNLRRLTRDQNNKMIGQLTELRQGQVGVKEYVWRTSMDERVRPEHREKNGRKFRWDSPPPDTGHPGQDILCRCVAQAVLSAVRLAA